MKKTAEYDDEELEILQAWEAGTVKSVVLMAAGAFVSVSFYDANIVACAVISGAPVLLTEDMHAGFLIDGLKLQNPFKEILP
jgi:predicted nucleic acid-binding protein